jgi:hypothetical protein
MKLTLEIDGDGDEEQFAEDMLDMANGDPDWTVSVVEVHDE